MSIRNLLLAVLGFSSVVVAVGFWKVASDYIDRHSAVTWYGSTLPEPEDLARDEFGIYVLYPDSEEAFIGSGARFHRVFQTLDGSTVMAYERLPDPSPPAPGETDPITSFFIVDYQVVSINEMDEFDEDRMAYVYLQYFDPLRCGENFCP